MNDRILLTTKDILEKDFKIDTRGYRPQEVDKFLDIIIHDYEEYDAVIADMKKTQKEIMDENTRLKQENRSLRTKLDVLSETGGESSNVSNADVLRRLSNLEKIIYSLCRCAVQRGTDPIDIGPVGLKFRLETGVTVIAKYAGIRGVLLILNRS